MTAPPEAGWHTAATGSVTRRTPDGGLEYAVYAAEFYADAQPQVCPGDVFQLTTEASPPRCRTVTVRFHHPVSTGRPDTGLGRLDRVTPLGLLFADTDGNGWERIVVPWANVAWLAWDIAA